MGNREDFLNDGSGLTRVEPDADKVIPDYLLREAEKDDEPWEKEVKAKLEIESWAAQFRKKFLEDFKVENRQTVAVWRPDAAASWLKEKVIDKEGNFERNRASEILATSGCVEDRRTEVMAIIGEDDEEAKPSSGSPSKPLSEVQVAPTAAGQLAAAQETALKIHKRKAVGSYGIILTEESCQLYRKGERLAEISVEDAGGVEVLAAEVEALSEEMEIEALFDLKDDGDEVAKIGWLKPKAFSEQPPKQAVAPRRTVRRAAPIVDGPGLQRLDQDPAPPTGNGPSQPTSLERPLPRALPQAEEPSSVTPGAATPSAPNIPGQDGK